MIEQYSITTTPKYNFPHPNMDTNLPRRFSELSINSLKKVCTNPFQLNQLNQQDRFTEPDLNNLRLSSQPLPLKPRSQETLITAVDTSTIKIGETSTGIIIAIRGATVWKQNGKYQYTRLGPFIFHITEENKTEVYQNLERSYFNSQNGIICQSSPNLIQMPMRLASLLERWLQAMVAKTANDALILFDGSLTSGTFDTPTRRMREILSAARKNRNTVLAFSKATTLRINGYLITDVLPENNPPYLLETKGLQTKPPLVLLGEVYVARLNKANIAFRLDIDKEVTVLNRLEATERLLGNDLYKQSYPETLRLAHILCTFTANEVLAMKYFVSCKHKLKIINRPDMHRLLFGQFGREIHT